MRNLEGIDDILDDLLTLNQRLIMRWLTGGGRSKTDALRYLIRLGVEQEKQEIPTWAGGYKPSKRAA